MKDKQHYLEKLNHVHILETSFYPYLELCSFEKGECIFHQGQTLDCLYILLEGRIKSCHTTFNGTTLLNAFSQPISVIGEIEFLNHFDIINDVYAVESTVCFRIPMHLYEQLLEDLLFMRYLAQTIAHKLYISNNNTSISINYPVENRLASYLIACQEQGIIHENFVQVAEMIGCSYRQLQRVLTQFIKNNYIKKLGRGHFLILDINKLKSQSKDFYNL